MYWNRYCKKLQNCYVFTKYSFFHLSDIIAIDLLERFSFCLLEYLALRVNTIIQEVSNRCDKEQKD